MSIEELLKYSADQAEAMTDAERQAFFAPYLDITRPERESAIYKEAGSGKTRKEKVSEIDQLLLAMPEDKRKMLLDMAKSEGLDIQELL